MQISENGLNLIRSSEGFRSHAYLDVAGLQTIGFGHRILAGESFPDGLTWDQAEALLQKDVSIAERAIGKLVHASLAQSQFDALVDFVFNLGAGRLAESTLLRDLNAGDYAAAAQQFLLWDHSGSAVIPALKTRREAEYQLFTGGPVPVQADTE